MQNLALIVNEETATEMHSLNQESATLNHGKVEPLRSRTEFPLRESLSENYIGELDAWFLGA